MTPKLLWREQRKLQKWQKSGIIFSLLAAFFSLISLCVVIYNCNENRIMQRPKLQILSIKEAEVLGHFLYCLSGADIELINGGKISGKVNKLECTVSLDSSSMFWSDTTFTLIVYPDKKELYRFQINGDSLGMFLYKAKHKYELSFDQFREKVRFQFIIIYENESNSQKYQISSVWKYRMPYISNAYLMQVKQ